MDVIDGVIPLLSLEGEYQEEIGNKLADGLAYLAPPIMLNGRSGRYMVASDDGVIGQRVDGFDPLTSQSWDSPARRVHQTFETREARLKNFFEYMFEADVRSAEIRDALPGDSVRNRLRLKLSSLQADRQEWLTARAYQDPANYTHTSTVDLSGDPDDVLTELLGAVDKVRPTNNRSDAYTINVVAGTEVAVKLRAAIATIVDDRAEVAGDRLNATLSDLLGAPVRVFSSAAVYLQNADMSGSTLGTPPSRVKMWDPSFLAVTATALDAIALPSFAHTPSFDFATLDGLANPNVEYLTAVVPDQFVRSTRLYAKDWHDPIGARVYSQSYIDVDVTNADRGCLFTVTGL